MKSSLLIVVTLAAAACGAPRATAPVSSIRFANAEPVWAVNDRADVAAPPAETEEVRRLRGFDISVTRRLDRALAARPRSRARGVNSLGEVPTSTWFDNRIGVREVSLEEIARGPGDGRGPDRSAPLRIVSGKSVGLIPGFIAEDAAGVKWMVKFEPTGAAAESAADITSQRLLWMAGYKVPENHAGYLTRADVVVAEDATLKTATGAKRRMTDADLDALFAGARLGLGDRYRVLFSRFLPGKPIGPTPQEGRRADDPNDPFDHEDRRELRGLAVFAAWLQHTDFKEMGTLDVWQEDEAGRHAVHHDLLDFGNTLGLYAANARPDDGHTEKVFDADHLRSLASFGLWRRPWEGVRAPDIRGVGAFDVEHFDPGGFSPFSPYVPFLAADDSDMFWAVRILLRITPAHIRAALEAGQYEDPRAVSYLTETLVGRQRKAAAYWLDRVSPLDGFTVHGDDLCFTDLVSAHALDDRRRAVVAAVFDYDARALGSLAVTGGCARDLPRGDARDGYLIVRLAVEVEGRARPAVEVHLARDERGSLRVIGVERRLAGE